MMYKQALEPLEYDKILGLISCLADSENGQLSVKGISPSMSAAELRMRLDLVKDIEVFLSKSKGFGLRETSSLDSILDRKTISGIILEIDEIIHVRLNIEAADHIRGNLAELYKGLEHLESLVARFPDVSFLSSAFNEIFDSRNQIKDNASRQLREIRMSMTSVRGRVNKALENSIKDDKYKNVIQDDVITLRSGRFVLMVKSDFKGAMKGIIHDSSNTGQSVFIEPMEVIELNNRLAKLEQEEKIEIRRILLRLTGDIFKSSRELKDLSNILVELDTYQALARFSLLAECSNPVISDDIVIEMEEGRHPLLDERLVDLRRNYFQADIDSSVKKVVSVSISLDHSQRGMVISGPNMGGKTVSLKTLGLLSLMALSGIPVPAKSFRVPLLKQVSADIGDKQEITKNLSTFSSHLLAIKGAIENLVIPSLVLLDEIGTGTDPEEGSALARSIFDHFIELGAFIVITTHSNYLKMYSFTAKNIKSASVEFDLDTRKPTYRLIEGSPGSSKAFSMAKSLGFPNEILKKAKSHLEAGHQYMEEFIDKLEQARAEYDELYNECERKSADIEKERESAIVERRGLAEQRRDFAKNAKDEWADILEKYEKKIKSIVEKTKDHAVKLELKRKASEELRRAKQDLAEERIIKPLASVKASIKLPDEMKSGATVRLRFTNNTGKLSRDWVAKKDKKIQIEIAGKHMEIFPVDIVEIIEPSRPSEGERMYASFSIQRKTTATTELNIIGRTADEVEYEMDKFLDDAVLAGLGEVRIVHGKGKGILKRAVEEYLRGHTHVKSYQTAGFHSGGEGATEVKLK